MADQRDSQPFGEWCVVEMLGHRRLAGYVQEVQLAGAGFLRLDIPDTGDETNWKPGATQYIAPGSVYALHPVSEDTARRAAGAWRPAPVQRWELPAAPAQPTRDDVEVLADELNDEDEDEDEQPF